MCDVGYGPEAWSEKWRVARVHHKCCACDESIAPGHRYHYLSGIWDGEPDSFKHCQRCWALYLAILDRTPAGDSIELRLDCGELWNTSFEEPPPDHVAALAFAIPGD